MVLLESDYGHVGPGWRPILEALDEQIEGILGKSEAKSFLRVLQVKEKFGGLRFYFKTEGVSPEDNRRIQDAVFFAEKMSFKMCEECGGLDIEVRHQKNQKFGWVKTLCMRHHALRDAGKRLYTMR